jgi:hypothetical protein
MSLKAMEFQLPTSRVMLYVRHFIRHLKTQILEMAKIPSKSVA